MVTVSRSLVARADRVARELAELRGLVERAERQQQDPMPWLTNQMLEALLPKARGSQAERLLWLRDRRREEPSPQPLVRCAELFEVEEPRPVPVFPAEPAADAPQAEQLAWCLEVIGLLWGWERGDAEPRALGEESLLRWVAAVAPGMVEVTREHLVRQRPMAPKLRAVPEPAEVVDDPLAWTRWDWKRQSEYLSERREARAKLSGQDRLVLIRRGFDPDRMRPDQAMEILVALGRR
jgi:hypothetical protein